MACDATTAWEPMKVPLPISIACSDSSTQALPAVALCLDAAVPRTPLASSDAASGGLAPSPLSALLTPPKLESAEIPLSQAPKLMLPAKMLRFQENQVGDLQARDKLTGDETPGSVVSRKGELVRLPPGLAPPPNTPSYGSALHITGDCRPCVWHWKPGGCSNGKDCYHCHLCPKSEVKSRKKTKSAFMRLGLVTPKPAFDEDSASRLAQSMAALSLGEDISDQCSTAAPTSEPECSDGSNGSPRCHSFPPPGLAPLPRLPTTSEPECSDGSNGSSRSHSFPPPGLAPLPSLPTTLEPECSDGSNGSPRNQSFPPPGLPVSPLPAVPISSFSSRGSVLHGSGSCQPCAWFWKASGCLNGAECLRCHDCPEGESKARKKSKVAMMRLGLVTPKADLAKETTEQEDRFFVA